MDNLPIISVQDFYDFYYKCYSWKWSYRQVSFKFKSGLDSCDYQLSSELWDCITEFADEDCFMLSGFNEALDVVVRKAIIDDILADLEEPAD